MIRKRLLTGAVSNAAAKVTAFGAWFFLTPFVLAQIGPTGYALWVLVGSLASYGLLLDLGIGGAVVKYVAQHVASGNRADARTTIASAAVMYAGLGAVAAAVGVVIASVVPALLRVPPEQAATASWLILLTHLNVAVTIAWATPGAVLRGLHRFDLYNAVNIASSLVEALSVVVVLLAGWGVLGMMAVFIPVNILTGVAAGWLVRRVAPDLAVGWRGANRAAARQLASFSTSLSLIQMAGRLQTKTAEFVIAVVRTVTAVTPYALARKPTEMAQLIAVQFLKVIMPLASELQAAHEEERLRRLYVVTSRVALGIGAPIAVVLMLTGGPFLTVWVGAEYAAHADLVTVLALAALITTSQWPAVEILQGMGRQRLVAWSALGAGIANVGLSVLLLPVWGLLGVAFGALIPAAVAAFGIVLPFANRTLGLSCRAAMRDIWLPGIAPAIVAGAFVWGLRLPFQPPSMPAVLGCAAVTAVVYAAGYLSMPAAAPERQLLSDMLASASQWLKRLRPGLSRVA